MNCLLGKWATSSHYYGLPLSWNVDIGAFTPSGIRSISQRDVIPFGTATSYFKTGDKVKGFFDVEHQNFGSNPSFT